MRKIAISFLLIVGLIPSQVYSQCGKNYCSPNLVPNPDFEICKTLNSGCTGNTVEMGLICSGVEGWYSTGDQVTPDYYGGSCNGNAGTNACGSGRFLGFYTSTGVNRRENVQCQLTQPLIAGKRYCVEFKVRNPGIFSSVTGDGLGVCFTPNRVNSDTLATSITAGGFLGYDFTPQVENPAGNFITNTCQTFSQSFVANGTEKWMIISNFKTDAQTQFQPAPGKTYVFIDDVSVREVSDNCCTMTLSTLQTNVSCKGRATGSATVIPSNGLPPYMYVWSTNNTTSSVTGLTAGTYFVTVSDASGTCVVMDTIVITEPSSGIGAVISSQINAGCTGSATGSATVTGTGGTPAYMYSWSPGGITTAAGTNLTAGIYNVTVTDANGCTATQAVAITQPASALNTGISTSANVTCTGSATGNATVTAVGGTPAYNYNWSNGQTNAFAAGLTAGTYTVTITDANGCSKTATTTIIESAVLLTASISSNVPVACTGNSSGSLTASSTGGTSPFTYLWAPSGATSSMITGLGIGTYTVSITDAYGCIKTTTGTITQPASVLGTSVSATIATCGQANGTASVTATGGTPAYNYFWSSGQTSSKITGLSAGSYNVTVTDANGCTNNTLVSVNNVNGPTVGISGTATNVSCTGNATGSATVTATGGTGSLTYLWTPSGGTTTTATGLTAGTYICTVTDSSGCKQGQTVVITEPASKLGSSISAQNNVACKGNATGSVTITATGGTPAYIYNWSTGETNTSIKNLTAGAYSVTITDANGCTHQQSIFITQPSTFVSAATSSTNADCGSSNGTATVTASGGTGIFTYSWTTPNNDITSLVTGLIKGIYTVIVTDSNGCTVNTLVTVKGSPAPVLNVSSKNNITCNGLNNGSATLTVSSGTSPYTYNWNPNVGANNSISGLSPGNYTVVVSDSAGCADTVSFSIIEPLPLLFTINTSSTRVCAGASITLIPGTPKGGRPPFIFNWLPNGPVVNPLIPTTYSVSVTDSSGCISQVDTIRIIPLPAPIAGFDTTSSGLFGQNYNFTDLSKDAISWYWDFGDGTTSAMRNPAYTYTKSGTYTITQIVTAASGCSDTLTKIIVIRPNILIPNVFTPNKDGVNDEFWIPNTGFENFELIIYDRWGLKLFVSNQGQIRWDGRTMAGEEVPDGTYYYLLSAVSMESVNIRMQGFINLIR